MTVARTEHRDRQFHSARDFETSASQIGDVEPFTDQLRRKAQLVICGNAADRADAEALMYALGVHPAQDAALVSSSPALSTILPGSHR